MPTIQQVADILESFAPSELAESWDNVGLLVGAHDWSADKVMTCLTLTPTTVAEAVEQGANLVITHHPLPFHALKTITNETTVGRLLLQLIAAGLGVYSPHTAFDSTRAGINQHLAIGLGLQEISPLVPFMLNQDPKTKAEIGTGRTGWIGGPLTLIEMADRVKIFLDLDSVQLVGTDDLPVHRVAIVCGSGGSLLPQAISDKCDCFITGETTFHTCLEAEASGVGLILPGHFASERFALVALADYLNEQLPGIEVWASRTERDCLRTY
jgi:dinuclear metal center YbgI/SA1388 family protein